MNFRFQCKSGRATDIAPVTAFDPNPTLGGLKSRSAAVSCRAEVCYPSEAREGPGNEPAARSMKRVHDILRASAMDFTSMEVAMNKRAAFTALMLLFPTIALAGENLLNGTWKLKSQVWTLTATGEKINQMGEHPNGYLSYSADGRMYAIITAENRVKPDAANPTDEQRVKLHKTMIAYAGTYAVEADKVIHHVDISWNEARTGTDQIRFFELDGNILTITTPPFKSAQDGREGRSVLVWEKVKAPTR